MSFSSVVSAAEIQRMVIDSIKGFIPVDVGVSEAEREGWNWVNFNHLFRRIPTVVGVIDVSSGAWSRRKVQIPRVGRLSVSGVSVGAPRIEKVKVPEVSLPPPPKIDLPSVELKAPSIQLPPAIKLQKVDVKSYEVPRVRRPDFAVELTKHAVRTAVLGALGYWGWAYDWMKWRVLDGIIKLAYYAGTVLNSLWDRYVQTQIDKVRDTINTSIKWVTENVEKVINRVIEGVNWVSKEARDRAQLALDEFKRVVEEDLNRVLGEVEVKLEDAVNSMVAEVYSAVGLAMENFGSGIVDGVNEGLARFSGDVAAAVEDAVNSGVGMVVDGVNEVLGKVENVMGVIVDESVRAVYEVVGIPVGWRFTPVLIRNRTARGFEWWAPSSNVRLHWVAIGSLF